MSNPARHNPLATVLNALSPEWDTIQRMPTATVVGNATQEATALATVAMAEANCLPKLGLKGPDAANWLAQHDVPIPEAIYDGVRDDQGQVMRLDVGEFFIEDNATGTRVQTLSEGLASDTNRVYRVERQDVGILIAGAKAPVVLTQTCAYDFTNAPSRVVLTRVAGVSCTILPQVDNAHPYYRIWCAPNYGVYLWTTLHEIVTDLGGGVVGFNMFKDR